MSKKKKAVFCGRKGINPLFLNRNTHGLVIGIFKDLVHLQTDRIIGTEGMIHMKLQGQCVVRISSFLDGIQKGRDIFQIRLISSGAQDPVADGKVFSGDPEVFITGNPHIRIRVQTAADQPF